MKIVIMGCGRVGALLARTLDADGHQVTIIDNDPYSFRRLEFSLNLPEFKGKSLLGNGINDNILKRALTQGDNRNILACQIAKYVYNVPRTICRIYDPGRREIFNALGLETLSPTTIMANLLKEMLER